MTRVLSDGLAGRLHGRSVLTGGLGFIGSNRAFALVDAGCEVTLLDARYRSVAYGRNSRIDALQAAALRVKLGRFERWNERRCQLAGRYGGALEDARLTLPAERPGTRHAWHPYVLRTRNTDSLRAALAARGVATLVHDPRALHQHHAYTELAWPGLAQSEKLADEVLSLPLYPQLEDGELERVCGALVDGLA